MIAVGSPTDARSLRIALLANTCADTSRWMARPAWTAVTSLCGGRGRASNETRGVCNWRASACAKPMPQTEIVDVRNGLVPGAVNTAATMKRK